MIHKTHTKHNDSGLLRQNKNILHTITMINENINIFKLGTMKTILLQQKNNQPRGESIPSHQCLLPQK